ncbi:hypothetical protein [Flavobacterium sp.]|uniref:hypothetical protein n=1 Tax=Flavobacterium sp. TaxID=239 RepID=UPI003D1040B4
MKKAITILFILNCICMWSQKKFEATNKQNGQTITLLEGNRVKITTLNRLKYTGELTLKNSETIAVNGQEIILNNLASIKNYPKGGRKLKNILFGVGSGLIVSSGVAGLAENGNAFSLFLGGTATALTGALVNNKHKTLIYRNYIFKIVE